jgi:hypothetical protein
MRRPRGGVPLAVSALQLLDAFLGVRGTGITLQLEENITIDAVGGADPNFPGKYMTGIIGVAGASCTFVMEQGSKLTNGKGLYPVVLGDSNISEGRFEMRGGEISNCKRTLCAIYIPYEKGTFLYYDGVFKDNDSNAVRSYYSFYLYDDVIFNP